MRVTVRIHEDMAADMAAWVLLPPGPASDRRLLLRLFLDDILDRLERHRGRPPGAVRYPGWEPPLFEWAYSPDLWVRYAVRDEGRLWWRALRITVLRLASEPLGPPGT